MPELTLPELMTIVREGAGADESLADGAPRGDVPFADLGYDSLALLETVNRIERRYGVRLSDDIADPANTPGWLLDEVNSILRGETRS